MLYSVFRTCIWIYSSVYTFLEPPGCGPGGQEDIGRFQWWQVDMTYIYPQDAISKLSRELLLLFPGPKVIFLCTDVKARHVFHILGHVRPGYMSVIFSYLSCLCEGEGTCAIVFNSSSGYAQEYHCKDDHFTLLLVCLVSFSRMSRKSDITSNLVLAQVLCVHIHARTHVHPYSTF